MFPIKGAVSAAHLLILLSLTFSGGAVEGRRNAATILVVGRSGSGISSTVRMLLGSFTPPKETEFGTSSPNRSVITEYTVLIPTEDGPSFLKIVDIEGVTDGRLPEEDAFIQAALKTYLTHPEGLNSQPPTAVLIVSPFDEPFHQFNHNQSRYIKILRRITEVEKSVYGNEVPDMNILLFTHLMNESKSTQRFPRKKLTSLKAAALNFVAGISPNIVALVGENKGEDFGLRLNEDSTYRLPTREFYPTNVFDAVANLADSNGVSNESIIVDTFAALRSLRDAAIKASRLRFNVSPDPQDVDFFTRTIVASELGVIDDNEVNSALQTTHDAFSDASIKSRTATTVPRLQTFLQSKNITRFTDLPSTKLDKVEFFNSLPLLINQDVVSLLEESLNITMPPFTQSLSVGSGYNVLKDEVLTSISFSPAEVTTWKTSALGYLLPSFLSCDKLRSTQFHRYTHTADSVDESVVQRQAYLNYPNKDAFNSSNFAGKLRVGFNLRPAKDDVPVASAVKEIRTHRIRLNEEAELSEEFKDSVNLLTPFDSSNLNSEKEWKSFFERWGTHVVSSGFLGGFIQGTLVSDDIVAAYDTKPQLATALEQLANLTQVEMEGVTLYGVSGGKKDPKLSNVHQLPSDERKEIVDSWESSLSYDPVGLKYQLELIPMSTLIGRVNESMAQPAATALDLFLRGNLKATNESTTCSKVPLDDNAQSENKWSVTKVNGKHVRPGVLVYNEEFNDFNTSAWHHITEDSDNHFFYWVNTRNNSYVKNGRLYLKPTFTADTHGEEYIYNGTLFLGVIPAPKCQNRSALCWKREGAIVHPIMSAMVTSKDSFKFTYGRLVIRAKMPGGDWIEPIMSLQPDASLYGDGLLSGQVHLVDTRGNTKLFNADSLNVGSEQTCSDIRYGTARDHKVIHRCLNTYEDEGFDKDFHEYELLWTPDSMTIKIDGEGLVKGPDPVPSFFKTWSRGRRLKNPWSGAENNVMAPFDVDFNIVMGLNVGGNTGFFQDDFQSPYPMPWSNSDINAPRAFWEAKDLWAPSWADERSALQIDFIRLYSLNETTSD